MIVPVLLAALMASAGPNVPPSLATDVRFSGADDLTSKFVDALRAALPAAKHMHPMKDDEAPALSLTVLFNVQPEGKRFSYAVDLMKINQDLPPDRLASFTGTCRETAIDACARDVVAKTDNKAKD
ncbi:MAG: hypothetical protein JWO65_1487 [Sphingomonas bacterium]|jgi:hypothetical protein|nr:hypothetical protein [Sphingomonas bacterium]